MCALNDAIEARELKVQCRHCGWSEYRTLSWFGTRRDMNCPTCCGVIVLNTSERRREISLLRRQVAALHEHFATVIPAVGHTLAGVRAPARALPSAPDLALAGAYRANRSSPGALRRAGAVASGTPNLAQKHRC